jgi:thiazole synthase
MRQISRLSSNPSQIPVVVDAGIGTPSEAAGHGNGADALLINSAIAMAANSAMMAQSHGNGGKSGTFSLFSGKNAD